MSRVWIIFLLLAGLLALAGCDDGTRAINTIDYIGRYPATDVTALDLNVSNISMRISSGSDASNIVYKLTGSSTVNIQQLTSNLYVSVEKGTLTARFIPEDANFASSEHLDIELLLPSKNYRALIIKGETGAVCVADVHCANIDIERRSGGITMHSIDANSIKAQTTNGSIIVEDYKGVLNARSLNGTINVFAQSLVADVRLATINGSIKLTVNNPPARPELDLVTLNGKVSAEWPWKFTANSYSNAGDGATPSIYLTTNNGSIYLAKQSKQ